MFHVKHFYSKNNILKDILYFWQEEKVWRGNENKESLMDMVIEGRERYLTQFLRELKKEAFLREILGLHE